MSAKAGTQAFFLDSRQKHAGMTSQGYAHFVLCSCTYSQKPRVRATRAHFAFSIALMVCWAISRSSSVRTTRTLTGAPSFCISAILPTAASFFAAIDGDSQVFQTLARSLPDHGCVLTYTASEHNGVYAAEHSDIRADVFLDAVAEHLDRQFCTIISPPCLIDDFPHVVQPANPLETALRIERFFQLVWPTSPSPS